MLQNVQRSATFALVGLRLHEVRYLLLCPQFSSNFSTPSELKREVIFDIHFFLC